MSGGSGNRPRARRDRCDRYARSNVGLGGKTCWLCIMLRVVLFCLLWEGYTRVLLGIRPSVFHVVTLRARWLELSVAEYVRVSSEQREQIVKDLFPEI